MVSVYRKLILRVRPAFSAAMRARRNEAFLRQMALVGGERIIDLGGAPSIGQSVPVPLRITIVNLPGIVRPDHSSPHDITYIEGDACHLPQFKDGSFDIAFCNSVIEHVGGPEKRAALAREARRLAPRYWVQTPSVWFPIEAHTYLPFWWFYPPFLKRMFIRRWRRILPEWCQMIEETTVLPFSEVRALFPDASIQSERFFGFPKSYIAVRLSAQSD